MAFLDQNPADMTLMSTNTMNQSTTQVSDPQQTPATVSPDQNQGFTVEDRLTNLLNKDNPFLMGAKTRAQQTAQSMGLQNSLMAATAGEKAAIETALPIAQQDAGYYQQKGLQSQQGDIQKSLYETQGDISAKLSKQGYEQDMALKQADIDWQKLDLDARMQVEYDRLDQGNKDRFDETTKEISDTYLKDYLDIMVNPNFKTDADRQAAINVLNSITEQRYAVAGSIANVQLDWGGSIPNISEPDVSALSTELKKEPVLGSQTVNPMDVFRRNF
jgi:hypothetical protein